MHEVGASERVASTPPPSAARCGDLARDQGTRSDPSIGSTNSQGSRQDWSRQRAGSRAHTIGRLPPGQGLRGVSSSE